MTLDQAIIRDNFSKFHASYDSNTNIQKKSAKMLVEESLKYLDPNSFFNILDLGSGTGNVAKEVRNHLSNKNRIVNCDFSLPMLTSSGEEFSVCSDICNLPIKDVEIFDAVFSSFCLQWLDCGEIKKLLDNLYKICSSGAIFSFCLPINGSFHEFLDANFQSGCNFHFIDLPKGLDVENLINSSDFEILELRAINFKVKYLNALGFLKKIKDSGANYHAPGSNNIINRKKIKKISDILFEKYDNYITWNVLYCYLIKK